MRALLALQQQTSTAVAANVSWKQLAVCTQAQVWPASKPSPRTKRCGKSRKTTPLEGPSFLQMSCSNWCFQAECSEQCELT